MAFTNQEEAELRRVLAAFKADLPSHEVGHWLVEIEPHRLPVEDEQSSIGARTRVGFGYVRAEARCVRCGLVFKSTGQHWVRAEGDHASAVADAKEAVERIAARSGLCWGDVPWSPEKEPHFFATLDGVAAAREP